MKSFRCGDVSAGCASVFSGTEEEILRAVAVHAIADHDLPSVTPELVEQVRAHLVTVG